VSGAERHRAIDAYTDAHPAVRRSRSRISADYRRFSGVLIDIFYDHLLASTWDAYTNIPLAAFTANFYETSRECQLRLPVPAQRLVDSIRDYDLLSAYAEVEGVEAALTRLSQRLSSRWHREFSLQTSVAELRTHATGLHADFAEFFPALCARVMQ
jgi:acyl carrier protein phosphodiesterase